ncbi:PAS domain S-box protein [Variovorax sp. WS11]|uniref:PAS domain S-box protein n=1 Tax=Variovorax sp. WS11 TaxID=1105204 RepID=UPI0011B22035|nr:PAS domain S-box protein [Variovorax sp. WS11]NDZ14563.1 PAS domain S-box protein [Variovorax sp. WS11]
MTKRKDEETLPRPPCRPFERRAEALLREHADLLDLTHDAMIVRDMEASITYWNRGAEQMYGWTAEEALGQSAPELLKTLSAVPLEQIESQVLRTGRWEGELVHHRRNGTPVVVESRLALQRNERGEPVAILATNTDITQHKRAEEARQDLEEQWRAAFEANPTMYFIIDAAGAILSVNPVGAEQLGWRVSQLVGQPVLNVFHEADREFVQGNAEEAFRQPGRVMRWKARKVRKDGTLLWVRESANAVVLRSGPVLLVACEDITERKHAEEALRESEERFRTLVKFSFDVYWESDAEHRFTRQEYSARFDRAPAAGSEIGKTRWEVPYLEPDEEAWRQHRAALDAHVPFRDFELARATSDGGIRHVSVSGLPMFDEAGRFTGYRGVGRDITERKRAEEALRAHLGFLESMNRVNRAMQGTNDLEKMMSDVLDVVLDIFACDRAWLTYPCDPEADSWRMVMEQTRPEFPGAFRLGAELPLDAEVATVFRTARAAGGAVPFGPGWELQVSAQLAERFSIRSVLAMALYPKGDQPYLFGLHQCSRPRTWTAQERRLFEEIGHRLSDALTSLLIFRSLRESEYLTRQVFESASDGVAVIGRDYRYQRVNEVYGRTWRTPAEAIVGTHVADVLGSDFFERAVKPSLDRCFDGEQFTFAEWSTTELGRIYLSVSYSPLRLGSERPEAALVITRDLTHHILASEALREAQAALARVNRVTTLGVLAASIAHEVNQPLGAMAASAGSCARWLAAQPPEIEKAQRSLERIARDGKRASEVIDRIRALVMRQPPRRDRVDLNQIILDVIAFTRDQMRRNDIALESTLAEGLSPVWGDRVQLQQVVVNLIVNAIEAMSAPGDRPRQLVIGASEAEGGVCVEVRDTGPGIASDISDKLFEPFHTSKAQGIGMGLSISRSIIEAHGGQLWTAPNLPHGAVFQFSLPVGQREP